MDIKERAQLVREFRLDLKQNANDAYDEQPIVNRYRARRAARKIKITRGNQAMHTRFYSNGGHSVDEVFGWDNPRRRKY